MLTQNSTTMTIRLKKQTKAALEKLAEASRRSKSFLAAEAVEAYIAREGAIIAGVQAGLDDMNGKKTVGHETVMADIRAILGRAS